MTCVSTLVRLEVLLKISLLFTGDVPYMCDQCGFLASSPYGLEKHKKRSHTTIEKIYSSQFCNFQCARKGNLSYTLSKPSFKSSRLKTFAKLSFYEPNFCGKEFYSSTNAKQDFLKCNRKNCSISYHTTPLI